MARFETLMPEQVLFGLPPQGVSISTEAVDQTYEGQEVAHAETLPLEQVLPGLPRPRRSRSGSWVEIQMASGTGFVLGRHLAVDLVTFNSQALTSTERAGGGGSTEEPE